MTETHDNIAAPAAPERDQATQEFIEKLRTALRRDGDFPANAKLVGELRMLVTDPKTTAHQVTEIILKEPSLGTRVLHVVNSSFYRRAKPIMTVSQAVIQIGMRPLAELCAGLVLLQKFVPVARRGGPFASCLQKTILTSLLTSKITAELTQGSSKADETGYLAGSFSELGTLLLAYYFPQVYENAIKRSEAKKQDLGKSIHEIIGLTPVELSLEVVNALKLPDYYKQALLSMHAPDPGQARNDKKSAQRTSSELGQALFASQKISSVLTHKKNKHELDAVLSELAGQGAIDAKILNGVIGELPSMFKNHCSSIDLTCPPLPEFVSTYSENAAPDSVNEEDQENSISFAHFVDEVREAVESREPTASIITRVMETFAWSLNFDRVLLLLLAQGRTEMTGRMLLGLVDDNFDPKSLRRKLGDAAGAYAPDAVAFKESRPIFTGDPIFEDGWPIAAIPIGFGSRSIGVIYADRVNPEEEEISSRDQAAIGVLAELLDRSVSLNAK